VFGLAFEALMVVLDKIALYQQHKASTGDTDTLIKDQLAVAKTLIQWLSRLSGAAVLRNCACEVLQEPDLARAGERISPLPGWKGEKSTPSRPTVSSPDPVRWKGDPAVTLGSLRALKRGQRKPAPTGVATSPVVGVETSTDLLDTVRSRCPDPNPDPCPVQDQDPDPNPDPDPDLNQSQT
jgi:hypothetical protein